MQIKVKNMKQSIKFNNLLIFFTVALLVGCGESGYKNSLQEEQLNGSVKSIRQLAFSIMEESGNFVILDTLSTDNFFIRFDKKGNEIERIFFTPSGDTLGIYLSEYDEKGRRVTQIGRDLAGNVIENLTFSYNNKGQRTERIYTSASEISTETYKYDRKGNLTEISTSMQAGKPLYSILFTYENNWAVAARVIMHDTGRVNEMTFTSDKQGRETEAVTNFLNSSGFSEGQETRTFTYESDAQGNWTTKIVFINGAPASLFERTIEYY